MIPRYLDPQPTKLAIGEYLHFFEFFWRQIGGMRVQGVDHAIDGAIHQFFIGSGVDVIGFDDREELTEGLDLFQRDCIPILSRINSGGKADADAQNEPDTNAQESTAERFREAGSGHG